MRSTKYVIPVSLAALLAACAQGSPTMVTQNYSGAFSSNDFAHQASVAPVPVVIHGRGAGLDHPAMVQAVSGALQGNTWGAKTNFVAQSSKNPISTGTNPYAMVFMVNGPSDVTSAQLCAKPGIRAGNAPIDAGDIRLIGALCRNDQIISGTEANATGIQGSNDPKLRRMIASAASELTSPFIAPTSRIN